MMNISDLYLRSEKLRHAAGDNIFCRNTDRLQCLIQLQWYIYSRLEQAESITLVIDNQDDLTYINYFLNKMNVRHLAYIDVVGTEVGLTEGSQLSTDAMSEATERTEKLKLQKDRLTDCIANLHRPVFDNLSLVQMNDRQMVAHDTSSATQGIMSLQSLVSNSDKSAKKMLLSQAQSIYNPAFRHLERMSPFLEEVIHGEIDNVVHYLLDLQEQASHIINLIDNIERDISQEAERDSLCIISKLRSHQNEINRLKKPNHLSYTGSEEKKIARGLNILASSIAMEYSDLTIDNKTIEKVYQEVESYIRQKLDTQAREKLASLQLINAHNSTYDVTLIIDKLCDLQNNINSAEIFITNYNKKAVSLFYLKEIVTSIKGDLEYASFFAGHHGKYLHWKKYVDNLSKIDSAIISQFIEVESSWPEALDKHLSKAYICEAKLSIQPIQPVIAELQNCIDDLIEAHHITITDRYMQSTTHDQLPLYIVTDVESLSTDTSRRDTHLITVNSIPESITHYNRVSVFAYRENFSEVAVSELRKVPDLSIINDSDIAFDIDSTLTNLTTTELNLASLYLGNALKDINPHCKIYKLKSVAIISFLSDAKNVELRELLYMEGVKEIFSSDEGYNLIPGLLSDREVTPIVILEDGIFNVESTDTLLQQCMIREEVLIAGIEVIDVDNYQLIQGQETMENYTKVIAHKNASVLPAR